MFVRAFKCALESGSDAFALKFFRSINHNNNENDQLINGLIDLQEINTTTNIDWLQLVWNLIQNEISLKEVIESFFNIFLTFKRLND